MPEPIRIRAQINEGITEVHVLMPHPMETGFRIDAAGQPVAAHYITEVEIAVAGRPVLTATLSRAVSQDPLLYFRFLGGSVDERITVSWADTRGERRVGEGLIRRA